jgi:hypothetical protein
MAGIGAAGSLGGAALSSSAAGNAAQTQAQAAEQAAQLQKQSADESLGFQQGVYNNNLALESPYYSSGLSNLTNLNYLMGTLPASASSTPIPTPTPINIPGIPGSTAQRTTSLPSGGTAQLPAGTQTVMPPGSPVPAPKPVGGGMVPLSQLRTASPDSPTSGVINGGTYSAQGPTGTPAGPQYPTGAAPAPGAGASPAAPSGTAPLSSLVNPQLGGAGSLMTPFLTPFQAPTDVTEQNDPGYQFRLSQGTQALQNSAAARGTLLTGDTAQAITNYGQDYASNEYGNVYNRALGQYQQAQNNSTSIYNQLANLAGLGQTATQQIAGTGQNAANNVSSTLQNSAGQIGQQLNNAAAATASGYVGSANAYSGAIGNVGNQVSQLMMLNQLNQNPSLYGNQTAAQFAGGIPG